MPTITVRPPSVFQPSLGLFDATAIGLGAIIGGGIFVVIGAVAGLAGPGLILSIIIAGTVSFLTAQSFIHLARWRPAEGAVYEYASSLISPAAGFLAGWMWAISNLFAAAAVALGLAHYLVGLWPGLPVKFWAITACAAITTLNYLGAKRSAAVNNLLVAAKICILIVFAIVGIFHLKFSNFTPFFKSGSGILEGSFYIFFAFAGFARVSIIAEEIKNPRRTVPRAVALALIISMAVYLVIGLTAIGLAGPGVLSRSASPLASAIRAAGAPGLVLLVSIGGIIAMASVLLTSLLGVSRMTYAMARDGQMPSALAALHPKFNTPHRAVLATGLLAILLVFLIDLFGVIAISTFASLFYYALANYSALKLTGRAGEGRKPIPVIGMILCLAFILLVPARSLFIGALLLTIGIILYGFNRSQLQNRS